jgi:hypothetical protein
MGKAFVESHRVEVVARLTEIQENLELLDHKIGVYRGRIDDQYGIGYTKDAKLAEAKALAGSVLTAYQACAQTDSSGGSCTTGGLFPKVGVGSGGVTGDNRWTVSVSNPITLTTGSPPVWTGGPIIVAGSGSDNGNMAAGIVISGGLVKTYCNQNGTSVSTANTPC